MTAASPRILSIIPPMTQLNTPYPATAYLTGFLRSRGFHAEQTDLALALVLELLSPAGLPKIKAAAEAIPGKKRSNTIKTFLNEFDRYQASIGPAVALLQGLDGSIAQPGAEGGQQLEVAVAHAFLAGEQLEQPVDAPQRQVTGHGADHRALQIRVDVESVQGQTNPEQRQGDVVGQQLGVEIDNGKCK